MNKFLKNIVWAVAGILLIIFLFKKINFLPSFKNIFSSKPVLIEATPILINEIRSLSQLMTVTFTDEIVMDTLKPGFGIPKLVPLPGATTLLPSHDKLVLIGRGKVIAGIDLRLLHAGNIFQEKDSIHLSIPGSVILETIINPSDFETFLEKGIWNEQAVINLKIKIRNEIQKRAVDQKILTQSDTRSKIILENFLKSLGYKKIEVQIRKG